MRAVGLRDPGCLVTGLISRELLREELPADTFGSPAPASVILAKTADRSILGCMNDMALMRETRDHPLRRAGDHRYRRPQPGATAQHQQRPGLPAAHRADHPAPARDTVSILRPRTATLLRSVPGIASGLPTLTGSPPRRTVPANAPGSRPRRLRQVLRDRAPMTAWRHISIHLMVLRDASAENVLVLYASRSGVAVSTRSVIHR